MFELVIFDIDGTLVDSGGVWAPAVQRAMAEVYRENQISLQIPTLPELHAIIGVPGFKALHPFVPPDYHWVLPEISKRIGLYGSQAMQSGAGSLFAGVKETLQELKSRGSFIALASNCGNSYLDEVQKTLGLSELVDLPTCLETPGVSDKASMLRLAMETFCTRRALMVGDRDLDLQAAHRNGIPFLAFSQGFGQSSEWEKAEGVFHDYQEFFPAISQRGTLLSELAKELGEGKKGQVVGISGLPASGKSLFVEELAAALRAQKVPLRLVSLEEFRLPTLEPTFDLRKASQALSPQNQEIVLVEGEGLSERELRKRIGKLIWLDVEESVAERRFAGRLGPHSHPQSMEKFLKRFQSEREKANAEKENFDLILNHDNLLNPLRLP